jgi:hypothetical protein
LHETPSVHASSKHGVLPRGNLQFFANHDPRKLPRRAESEVSHGEKGGI